MPCACSAVHDQRDALIYSASLEIWQSLSATMCHTDHYSCAISGISNPHCNKIFTKDLSSSQFEEIFSKYHSDASWFVAEEHLQLQQWLQERHFAMEMPLTFMALEIQRAMLPLQQPTTIVQATSLKDLQTHFAIAAVNFPMSDEAQGQYYEKLKTLFQTTDCPLLFFTGYLEEKPIVSGRLFLGSQFASLYHIGTLPEARKQGAASQMMTVLIEEAKRRGYERVTLSATLEGETLYTKLGFTKVQRYYVYTQTPNRGKEKNDNSTT